MATQKPNIALITTLLLNLSLLCQAQVGINKDTPDSCAILHIEDTKRGVLLPSIENDDFIKFNSITPGLLYFNTTEQRFRYYNGNKQQWQCVNPWSSTGSSSEIVSNQKVTVNNNLTADTINAVSFNGNGTIPLGGIIMWSGKTAPKGWALCDGKTVNGYTTPDLSGRFIVSYDAYNTKPEYSNPGELSNKTTTAGNKGGTDKVSLDITQIPPHDHDVVDYGHKHKITGQKMQKSGTTTTSVVALDAVQDQSWGDVTYDSKISVTKTGITVRKTGGIYTYQTVQNTNVITGCTVWQYTCTTGSGTSIQASSNIPAGITLETQSNSESLPWAGNKWGYKICVAGGGYCGVGYTDQYVGQNFTITSCSQNSNYDAAHPDCVPDYYNPNIPLNETIRINENWTPAQPVDIRPPYYVLAFIMRVE